MLLLLTLTAAWAGYGDPVAGIPDAEARRVHLWTDAVRVDPEAFEDDYLAGGCSFYTDFTATEQTPQAPLRHDAGLMAAARAHNDDMIANNWFAHDSSDGTYWADRIWSYYGGWLIGENILVGASTVREAVTEGWMCSAGHRANIMLPDFEDIGAAFGATYGTMDLGASGAALEPLRTAAHEVVGGTVSLYASWGDAGAPDTVEVVVDGIAQPMSLRWGAPEQGVYAVDLPASSGCHTYYVVATRSGVAHHFPETGSYGWFGGGWANCAWDDPDAEWIALQLPPASPDTELTTDPWVGGAAATLTVTGAEPGTTVHFMMGTALGAGSCPAVLGGQCLGVTGNTRKLGTGVADASGLAELVYVPPAGAVGRTVHLQAVVDVGPSWTTTLPISEQIL